MNRKLILLPTLLVAGLLLVGGSCTQTTNTTTNTTTEKTNTAAVENTNTADVEEDTTDTQWDSATDQGDIPSTQMAGTINDEEVTLLYASVTDWDDYYSWTFSEEAPDYVCGVTLDHSEISFDSDDVREGTYTKEMDEEEEGEFYAYYLYYLEDGTPYSVNDDWSATVVVDSIEEDVGEDDFGSTYGKVTGWAEFEFDDGTTAVSGAFEAELCTI